MPTGAVPHSPAPAPAIRHRGPLSRFIAVNVVLKREQGEKRRERTFPIFRHIRPVERSVASGKADWYHQPQMAPGDRELAVR